MPSLDIKTAIKKAKKSKSKTLVPNKPLEDKTVIKNLNTNINISDPSDVGSHLLSQIIKEGAASGNIRGPLDVATGPLQNMKTSVGMVPLDPRTGMPLGNRDEVKNSTHTLSPEKHNRSNARTPTTTRYGTEVTRKPSADLKTRHTSALNYGIAIACLHILTGRSQVQFPLSDSSGPSSFVQVSLGATSSLDPAHHSVFPVRIPWDKWEYGVTPVLLDPDLPKIIYRDMLHRKKIDDVVHDLYGRLVNSYREKGWAV